MYVDSIKKRVSVRTYADKPINKDVLEKIEQMLKGTDNPFGAEPRFCIVEKIKQNGRIGTYGFIRGQKAYIAGCVKRGEKDLEGYGYAFEKIILKLTNLGLGTCWLGGTLSRGAFSKAAGLKKDEMLPAVTPIGYAGDKKSVVEKVVAAGAGARNRLQFGDIFFDGGFSKPLKEDGSKLCTCLEMVRIGPSASNKQPWRAVKKEGRIHFYLAKSKGYSGNNAFGFTMQKIDMGIAACHFDMAARELGLSGRITVKDPGLPSEFEYSFSWEEA